MNRTDEKYRYSYAAWAEAFTIFAQFSPDATFEVVAEHDIIYAGDKTDDMPESVIGRLLDLGWEYDDTLDCFYHNV